LAVLALVVIKECLGIDQHRYNDISLLAFDEVAESDRHRELRLCHIEDLIFDILNIESTFLHSLQFLNDRPKEHINDERVNSSFVIDIEHSPEILDCLWGFFVIHGQNEFQEAFVVHLAIYSWVLLKDTIDHY
jgi:hypothetical protein